MSFIYGSSDYIFFLPSIVWMPFGDGDGALLLAWGPYFIGLLFGDVDDDSGLTFKPS